MTHQALSNWYGDRRWTDTMCMKIMTIYPTGGSINETHKARKKIFRVPSSQSRSGWENIDLTWK